VPAPAQALLFGSGRGQVRAPHPFRLPEVIRMPYFVYRVAPNLELRYIDTKDRYQEARALVRSLRAERTPDDDGDYRLIFANQQGEAEKLLSTPRDERVIGED
jgi:hypothetical protein